MSSAIVAKFDAMQALRILLKLEEAPDPDTSYLRKLVLADAKRNIAAAAAEPAPEEALAGAEAEEAAPEEAAADPETAEAASEEAAAEAEATKDAAKKASAKA